jgi:hypothetical protein
MANANVTVKLDLAGANTIRAALIRHRDALMDEARMAETTAAADRLRTQAGHAEDLLRRDFNGDEGN